MRSSGRRDIAEGTVLGKYVLLQQLGSGGMGVVYAALDPDLDRKIALKLLRTDKIRNPEARRKDRARLLAEAQAMARLDHPNVVTVHDVGTIEGQVFIAMDFIDGETMTAWLERGPHDVDEFRRVLIPAGRGLAAAHRAGMIHRDFKPDNVLIDTVGCVHVLDFGLAIGIDVSSSSELAPGKPAAEGRRMTNPGQVMGTPAYMSPEQHRGRPVDERSDQFSWCVTAWEALYGTRPFGGKGRSAIAFKVVRGELDPPPPEIRVPAHVHKALVKGLRAEPDRRWPSMDALLAVLEGRPHPRRRRRRWIAAAVAGTGTLAGVWLALPRHEITEPCPAVPVDVGGVWSAERRDALDAVLASNPVAADRTRTWVNTWARAWSDVRYDGCIATFDRREQSRELFALQDHCLAQRRAELADALELIIKSQVPPELAPALVSGLPLPQDCADRLALLDARDRTADRTIPTPTVEALDARLDRAVAWSRVGEGLAAQQQAAAVLDEATSLGDPLLLARANWIAGDIERRAGQHDLARAKLHAAAQLAVGRNDFALAARAWTALVWSSATTGDDLDEALEWGHYAASALERLERHGSPAPRVQGSLLLAMGALLEQRGALADAEAHLTASLEAFRRVPLPPELAMAHTLAQRGEVRGRRGSLTEAAADLDEALRGLDAYALPDDAPPRLRNRLWRADIALAAGELDVAEAHYRAVRELDEQLVDDSWVAVATTGLAEIALTQRNDERARLLLREAIERWSASERSDSRRARTEFSLAEALARNEPTDPEARMLAEQAATRWRSGAPVEHAKADRVDRWLAELASDAVDDE